MTADCSLKENVLDAFPPQEKGEKKRENLSLIRD